MREAWAAILLVTTAVLAGCIGGEVPEDGERIEATAFGLESALDTVREGTTLAQAPQWAIGEWWTYSFEQVPSGTEETFTIVVAGAEPGNYLVGLPAEEVPIMPFIFHLPGVGQVRMTDLAYEAHDEPFELLKFPLEEGVSWDGVYWASAPMTVSVDRVEGSTAELTLASGDQEHALTYDAEVGYLTHYRIPAQGELEVELELVDHGFGYEGDVM
ncbi:MAG: hypothetical protein R3185_07015, partial [Candidatus Thermoplasmatota archaeon]|nr:hypothetical protein [Candidatus Thermoplasmatota archaeon]